jgi:hypothetical protein
VIREKAHQKAFFFLVRLYCDRWPELKSVYAVPNGGGLKGGFDSNRGIILDLLECGLEPGAPDINVDVARHGFHGMRIEMKSVGGAPSKEQIEWYNRHRANGYHADFYVGYEEAWLKLLWYIGVPAEVISSWKFNHFSHDRMNAGKGVRRVGNGSPRSGKSTHAVATSIKKTNPKTNVKPVSVPIKAKKS